MLADASGGRDGRGDRAALLVIFFLSGSSALVHQVVWSRSLALVFGSTTYAVSTVLAAFMGGLAAGSLWMGRRGDRVVNPLRFYAMLELAIAVMAVAVLFALPALGPVYRLANEAAGGSIVALSALRFLLACAALLPPTIMMGATLPILSAHVERSRAAEGGVAGRLTSALYAANTVGAVGGAALAGFALLPSLGMRASAIVAALANLAAAAGALRLSRRPGATLGAGAGRPLAGASAPDSGRRSLMPVMAVALGISGAGALIFEVGWTRVLSLVLGSSTQAFSIMLTTFLAGLAAGSAWATRRLGRFSNPMMAFAVAEIGAGLSAFLGLYLFAELPWAFLVLFGATGESAPALFQMGRFFLAGLVMLVPTLFMGATFPLAVRALMLDGAQASRSVGFLYAVNTAGAIAGALAAGFLLIPVIGLQPALIAGCLVTLLAGALALAFNPGARPVLRYGMAGVLLACLPALPGAAPEWNSMLMSTGVFQYAARYRAQFASRRQFMEYHASHPQLFYKDGPTTAVAVEKRAERIDGQINIVLSINGKVDASSVGDMATQIMVGQLPLLVSPHKTPSVMVIGMGSGVTAGSALSHPISKLSLIEIEPAIIEASRWFDGVNNRPLEDPRTVLRINDARNDLMISRETYDVIISEPSNPWLSGPARLFTREFFELAASRLNEGGVLSQWVQLYGMDGDSVRAVLRTFASVFPHRLVFKGAPGDIMVLGSMSPLALNPREITARLSRPEVSRDLARVAVGSLEDLLARFRLSDTGVEEFVARGATGAGALDGPLNTDDNAMVEFAATRNLYRNDDRANDAELGSIVDRITTHVVYLDLSPEEAARGRAELSAALARRLIPQGLGPRVQVLLTEALGQPDLPVTHRAELMALQGDLHHRQDSPAEAAEAWRQSLALDRHQPRAIRGLAQGLLTAGKPAAAAEMAMRAPADPGCRLLAGRARHALGDHKGVLVALAPIGDDDPEIAPLTHLYRGRSLLALGRATEASRELESYFSQHRHAPRPAERSIEAAEDLARAYLVLGQPDQALTQYRTIARLADSLTGWHRGQALKAAQRSDPSGVIVSARGALRWNPKDAASQRLLARGLNDAGQHEEALAIWREVDAMAEGDGEALRNIAGLSIRLGRVADAVAAYRRLQEVEGDPAAIAEIESLIQRLETIGQLR